MVEIFGHTFEHLTIIRALGNPIRAYGVRAEDGYYIHKSTFEENEYKTVTSIYSDDSLDGIIIIPEAELPEDAIILGVTPVIENASTEELTEADYTSALNEKDKIIDILSGEGE